jgi:nucleoside-diphosphate-sugar epimerase
VRAPISSSERVPVREDDATVPTSPYGSSKLMPEIMLRDAGSTLAWRHVILRYFTHLVTVEAALGLRQRWRSSPPTTRTPARRMTRSAVDHRALHPAIAHSLVGKVVSVLEDR